jgi:uncharacterized phage protein (TIGR02220 family)
MARKRMIDPDFFLDEGLAELTPHARLLYIGSWTLADDRSFTLPYRPRWVKAQIFPYEMVDIDSLVKSLVDSGKFLLFENDTKQYIFIPKMAKYQKIDRPSGNKYPYHPDHSNIIQRVLANGSTSTRPEVNISKENISSDVRVIIEHLNQAVGSRFDHRSKDSIKHISARLRDGFSVDEIKTVIDKKAAEWLNDDTMHKYLRPTTLFNREKFENYLNQPTRKGPRKRED